MKELLVITLLIAGASSFSCGNCDSASCVPPPTCRGSFIVDACGCCMECTKVEGEKCGGPEDSYGVCDTGLVCHKAVTDLQLYLFNTDGICGPPK